MTDTIDDLYDYEVLRGENQATMFVVSVQRPTLVLGGSQSRDVVDAGRAVSMPLRRRRGGGGLVLLQPDDLWIDWWIPANDPRWSGDVRRSSLQTGRWWHDVLAPLVGGVVTVHEGPLVGELAHRVVCFAGRGPGEVFVDDRKAVGLTQWRVREGIFLSTVLHAKGSEAVLGLLAEIPRGLGDALDHHTTVSLGIDDLESLAATLAERSGPWSVRQLILTD